MKQMLFALSLGFGGLILATNHAYGQQTARCGDRDGMLAKLAEGYGETRRGLGLAANNAVVEVFVSDQTGTWTITVTLPSGVTCLLAAGNNYEALSEAAPIPGSPA